MTAQLAAIPQPHPTTPAWRAAGPRLEKALTQQQLVALLDRWVGDDVSIRVVSDSDDLLAVFQGRLCDRSAGKRPALFWPLRTTDQAQRPEEPGVYLHPERFQAASAHEGSFVLELRQAGVTLNIRRL